MYVVLVLFRGQFWCPFTHASSVAQARRYRDVAFAAGYPRNGVIVMERDKWEKKRSSNNGARIRIMQEAA